MAPTPVVLLLEALTRLLRQCTKCGWRSHLSTPLGLRNRGAGSRHLAVKVTIARPVGMGPTIL